MTSVTVGPHASQLLQDRHLDVSAIHWPSRAEAGTLVVAASDEWRGLVGDDATALLLLLKPEDSPVSALRQAAIPVEIALAPLSAQDLSVRARWLLELARPKPTGAAGKFGDVQVTQRLALAGRVAAGAAHETRNALAYSSFSLKYLIEAMESGGTGEPRSLAQAASEALDGINRALDASRFVLNLARGSALERRPLDLNANVTRTVRMMTFQTQGVAVELQLGTVPEVLGDAGGICQVVMNLLLNAVSAMRSKGRILVRTEAMGERVLLSVSDSGPGIPRELAPRLFEPFATSGGTGLGLAISRSIIEAAKGSIEVGQGPLGGADFRVLLPKA